MHFVSALENIEKFVIEMRISLLFAIFYTHLHTWKDIADSEQQWSSEVKDFLFFDGN